MKVLFIGKYFPPFKGGMEDHLYNLCFSLKDQIDFEILVFSHEGKGSIESFFGKRLIRLKRNILLFSTPISFSIFKYVWKFDGDIIHLHEPNPLGALACLLFRQGKKLVVTYHYDVTKQKTLFYFYKFLQIRILKIANRIIVTARNNIIYSNILNQFINKCSIIPLGIDESKFACSDSVLAESNLIKETYQKSIVLFVGRLTYYKGLDYLINAVKDLDCVLLIIGKGEEEKRLKKLAENSNNIVFLSNVDNLLPYYYASDLFVLPSIEKSEAFGIVQLEAMICKLPVICTNLKSGVPEVQIHGNTGLIVEPQKTEEIQKAIQYLLDNPTIRLEFGSASRDRVLMNYTNKRNATAHRELYENL